MKSIFIALFSLMFISAALPQDYYYYFGKKIELNRREDKAVIVTNELGQNKASMENEIKSVLDAGDELKNSYNNTYEVIFKNNFGAQKVQNFVNRFAGRENLIKFIAPAYYTDNLKITIICADEFMVKLKSENDRNKLDLLNIQNGVQIVESFPGSRMFNMKTFNGNSKTSLELSDIYLATGLFEYAEPNFIYPDYCLLNFTPNDPLYTSQWHLNNTSQTVTPNPGGYNGVDSATYKGITGSDMKVNLAWNFTTGDASLELGVVDTGIDSTHPDLRLNLLAGYDGAYNVNTVPRDSNGHGTCTGGLVAASGNNALGVTGIAYGCKLRSYRIFNGAGSAANSYITRVFQRAKTNGAAVLSNSWGGGSPASSVSNAIDSCALYGNSGKGCVILFSSGNEGRNPPSYPSYLRNVVCVGASTASDQKKAPGNAQQFWWGGNYGSAIQSDGSSSYFGDIDCVAPTITVTTDIQGTGGDNTAAGTAGDYYYAFNGTSCSCPNAAGVAGLIYSVNTSQTAAQVKDALLRGCDKIDNISYDSAKAYGQWNEYFGYGRVNAYNSVRLAAGVDVIPPTIKHANIESSNSTYPSAVTAAITDLGGGSVDNTSPKVIYRTNKNNAGWSAFDTVSYSSLAGSVFAFKIPGYGWETQVQYYLTAKDNSGNTAYFPIHAPDTTNLCYYAIGNIQSVTQKITGPTSIPTSSYVYTGTTTFASFKILKTKVRLSLRHTRVSDINVALVSPLTSMNATFGMKCLFSENSSGTTTGISNPTITDSASSFWNGLTQPYTSGLVKPDYSFAGFNGTSSAGAWKLLIYDGVTGTGGTFDSCSITLYKTSGTTSPSAGFNTASDSICTFNGTQTDTINYYLKNRGTASLTISGTTFSGTYASKFSLISSPASIAAGDSGLFKIRCNPLAPKPVKGNEQQFDNSENATLDITTNDPSKPTLKVSLQTPDPLPVELANFTSSVDRNNVKLNWTTTFEQNNSGFDIERKLVSTNEWVKVTNISGAGNSNTQINYSYSDNFISTGKYNYRLKQIDFNGNYKYYELANEVNVGIPTQFSLSQNYPNPFNPSTKINYDLPFDSKVSIKIFDLTGREISSVVNQVQPAGYYSLNFNASNLASGIYFYSIIAEGGNKSFVKSMKMVLVK
ncbi:MAG: S8 family serine peptidase [Bacteroidetes bacterium]|nr:S8 family serine peptidase [Bacteroidota bacterium]